MVLIIHKINTVKNIYTLSNTQYRYSAKRHQILNTRQNLVLSSALSRGGSYQGATTKSQLETLDEDRYMYLECTKYAKWKNEHHTEGDETARNNTHQTQ